MSDAFNSLKNMGGNLKMVFGKLREVDPSKRIKNKLNKEIQVPQISVPKIPKFSKLKSKLK